MASLKTLLLVGDVMLGRLVNRVLTRVSPEYPWGDTLPFFKRARWRCGNLECALADQGEPWNRTPKLFHFRSDARNVAVLRAAGFDAVSLANNHVLDFGTPALLDTFKVLHEAGIAYAGAGLNLEQATRPVVANLDGPRIGMLAFTDNEPEWAAQTDAPGVFYVPVDEGIRAASALIDLVRQTKPTVDCLIVSAHWGGNWGREPPRTQVALGRALIEAGADVVLGHSPHVFRGIELHRGRPILYSVGDFIDDYAVDPEERNDQTFLFLLDLTASGLSTIRLHPVLIEEFRAHLARGDEAQNIAQKMADRCHRLGTVTQWNVRDQCLEILLPAVPTE